MSCYRFKWLSSSGYYVHSPTPRAMVQSWWEKHIICMHIARSFCAQWIVLLYRIYDIVSEVIYQGARAINLFKTSTNFNFGGYFPYFNH